MTTARRHAWRAQKQNHKGFVLIGLIALLAMGALYFFVGNLSPENQRERAQQQTGDALMQAREALIGYALRYREDQINDGQLDRVYGYLPLPDLGSTRNNNGTDPDCYLKEGCESQNFLGNAINNTVIGRFPWRTLGTGPLKDSNGECLWYAISGSHQRQQRVTPMNWDTLSQLDVVVANGTAAMASAIASAHERPIAVIFSPGPPLSGQDRSTSATDTVTECGGNYEVSNYLDPKVTTDLVDVTNYFAAGTNSASGDTSGADKKLSAAGLVNRRSDATLWAGNCPSGSSASCSLVANDSGVAVTSDLLFSSLRGSSYFRTDINSMLDRMAFCLRDKVAAGTSFAPDSITGFTPPADKNAGRIPSDTCYNDAQNPLGYFSHYSDQIFLASRTTSDFTVTVDGSDQTCPAAILFASQRGTGQLRDTTTERDTPSNYLEGSNLSSFTGSGLGFAGQSVFAQASTSQTASEDIVRCVPSGANLSVVESPNLTPAKQLVAYDPATSTLTLGKEGVVNSTDGAANLFGCAWTADEKKLGSGFRSYYQFTFSTVGTSVGNTGYTFALIDTESNPDLPCGKAGNHLGYSGNNNFTPKVKFPKIGIEFDQSRNSGFILDGRPESSTNKGRNDPCGTTALGCAGYGYNSHAAIVYWGHETANGTDSVTLPDNDDNVHGFPSAASIVGSRRPPKNPEYIGPAPGTEPGFRFVNLRTGGKLFHVRVEVTPSRTIDVAAAENSKASITTKAWILADSVTVTNQIAAMKDTTRPMSVLYPTFVETLSDTAAVYDVAESACVAGACPTNQTCGTDNVCYRQGLRTTRIGFTGSQRTQDQEVNISNMFTTWLP